jgi:hypothetical protein
MHNARNIITRLEAFGPTLAASVAGVSDTDARVKPAPTPTYPHGAWSITEIVWHLVDEELEDFGVRLFQTLEDPHRPWPSIDPQGAAEARRYNERSLGDGVSRFLNARAETVKSLRRIASTADWTRAYTHPRFGPIRAGDLLAAWGAHDALHLRQIAKRLFELASRDGAPYMTTYAGEWGA